MENRQSKSIQHFRDSPVPVRPRPSKRTTALRNCANSLEDKTQTKPVRHTHAPQTGIDAHVRAQTTLGLCLQEPTTAVQVLRVEPRILGRGARSRTAHTRLASLQTGTSRHAHPAMRKPNSSRRRMRSQTTHPKQTHPQLMDRLPCNQQSTTQCQNTTQTYCKTHTLHDLLQWRQSCRP